MCKPLSYFESRGILMIIQGDCLEQMKTLDDNSVDSIVSDPPYGLSFMNKKWDYQVPSKEIWTEALRVLKPGGHLLAFGGTRTYHRLVVNIEDAGFEIRDQIQWNFGSGFPKSCDIKRSGIKQGIICECEGSYKLLDLWQRGGKMEMLAQENQDANMQSSMQRSASGPRMENSRAQGPSGMDKIKSRVISEENDGLEQSCMEGRNNVQAKQRELHRTEICPVSSGVYSDGSQRRLHNGTSFDNGETLEANVVEDRSSSSQRPQHEKQLHNEPRVMADKSKPQESGAWPRCPACFKHVVPEGLGTALKPANEPICVARKPLEKGLTLAQNVLKYGTGAINIDESRIAGIDPANAKRLGKNYTTESTNFSDKVTQVKAAQVGGSLQGRWPANIILDETAAEMLDEQSGTLKSGAIKKDQYKDGNKKTNVCFGEYGPRELPDDLKANSGGASRFFYCAKASKSERNRGLEGMPEKESGGMSGTKDKSLKTGAGNERNNLNQNFHPTVKPIKLMEYLIRLVTPKGGTILDPFMGSGSTGVAAKNLGFKFIGIELNPEYAEIAQKRIEAS